MNITQVVLQFLAVAGAGILTVVVAYFLIKSDIQQYFRFKSIAANKEQHAFTLPLRLQAYERLIIFIERINPANLLVRLHQPGISPMQLQSLIINEIRTEYEHNIAQQLYVDALSWSILKKLKDDTIAMFTNAVQHLPPDAVGLDLSKKVLQHMAELADNPYDLAVYRLKSDIQKLF